MLVPHAAAEPCRPRIRFVQRVVHAGQQKIAPTDDKPRSPSGANATSEPTGERMILNSSRQKLSISEIVTQPTIINTNDGPDEPTKPRAATLTSPRHPSREPRSNSPTPIKQPDNALTRWFNRLTRKQKILSMIGLGSILLIICASAAVLPAVFICVLGRSNSSPVNIYSSNMFTCSSTTCIGSETPFRTSAVTALYPFDGNTNSLGNYATGIAMGLTIPATYNAAGYVDETLQFTYTLQQYIFIPYVNLTQQSFTIELWLLPSTPATLGNYGIFGLCDSNSICLALSLQNDRVTLSFDAMHTNKTLMGATTLIVNIWTHVAVVYNAVLSQQLIYINGLIDAVSNGILSGYQGSASSGTATIGLSSSSAYGLSYLNGWVDHFTISAGVARTACQIYNDATLIAYYPFDTNGTLLDHSVNLFTGIASDITMVTTGHIQQAISFTSNMSYFQAQCFSATRDNNNVTPFSFALWVNPTTNSGGGTLVHVSTSSSGAGAICYDLLGFTVTGVIIAQLWQTGPTVSGIQGPVIPINTWTHVAVVYSQSNGLRLFINGQLNVASVLGGANLNAPGYTVGLYITLGNVSPSPPVTCPTTLSIVPGQFSGAIDDLRIYNRELNSQEICVLANM